MPLVELRKAEMMCPSQTAAINIKLGVFIIFHEIFEQPSKMHKNEMGLI